MNQEDGRGPMSAQHAGLLRRVRGLMRPVVERAGAGEPAPPEADTPPDPELEELQDRIARLESVVEGLQDALYRHSRNVDDRMDELRARTEPEAIARELSADARRRGL
jgi:hypothetical protein